MKRMPMSGPARPAACGAMATRTKLPARSKARTSWVAYPLTYARPSGPNAMLVGAMDGTVTNTPSKANVSLRYLRISDVCSLTT